MNRSSDPVVIAALKEWACTSCSGTGDLLIMDDAGPLCLHCADLGHLEFLPSGDAALTRRAKKASRLSAVVVRWSRSRKRYERQGILAEPTAIERAEQECLSDAEVRERRRARDAARRADEDERFFIDFADAIRSQFPGCPACGDARQRSGGAKCPGASARPGGSSSGRCGLDPPHRHRLRPAADGRYRSGRCSTPGT